jgi:hypothetical protein
MHRNVGRQHLSCISEPAPLSIKHNISVCDNLYGFCAYSVSIENSPVVGFSFGGLAEYMCGLVDSGFPRLLLCLEDAYIILSSPDEGMKCIFH